MTVDLVQRLREKVDVLSDRLEAAEATVARRESFIEHQHSELREVRRRAHSLAHSVAILKRRPTWRQVEQLELKLARAIDQRRKAPPFRAQAGAASRENTAANTAALPPPKFPSHPGENE